MSDPAKTPEEIEDVLASVRRLVSDHGPARDGAKVAEDAAISADIEPSEALVLTPSFRVTDPEDPWVPVTTSRDTTPERTSPDAPVTENLISAIVTATEAPAQPSDAEWQPDDKLSAFDAVGEPEEAAPEPQEWADDHSDIASEEDIEDLIRLDGADAPVTEYESETGDDNWPEGGAEAALLTLVARRDPAPEAEAEAEADGSEVDDDGALEEVLTEALLEATDDDTVEAEEVADSAELQVEEGPVEDDLREHATAEVDADIRDEDVPDEVVHDDDDDDDDDDLDEDIRHEEAQREEVLEVAAPYDDPTETSSEGEATPEMVESAERVFDQEPEAVDDTPPASPVEDLGPTPTPFTFPETDEGILDEDTLREIIVEVVREELQGVLGQRITRNVRKMVRREIRLALAAEDLE